MTRLLRLYLLRYRARNLSERLSVVRQEVANDLLDIQHYSAELKRLQSEIALLESDRIIHQALRRTT